MLIPWELMEWIYSWDEPIHLVTFSIQYFQDILKQLRRDAFHDSRLEFSILFNRENQ